MHFSNHLDTANGLPLPPPNIFGVKCTGVHKLQHCLGERGKIKADRVNCPKNFGLHYRPRKRKFKWEV